MNVTLLVIRALIDALILAILIIAAFLCLFCVGFVVGTFLMSPAWAVAASSAAAAALGVGHYGWIRDEFLNKEQWLRARQFTWITRRIATGPIAVALALDAVHILRWAW